MSKQSNSGQTPINGKVATILNARELAINIGRSKGVELGMRFKVLAEKPIQVVDPETGEGLGILDREKVRVKAIEVQDRLTVCRTYSSYTVGGGPFYPARALESLVSPPRRVTETLKVDSSSFPTPLSEEESYVKSGDRVVQLIEAELKNE